MADLKFGTSVPTNIYLGPDPVSGMYFGSTLVWPLASPTPTPTITPSITPTITQTPSLTPTPTIPLRLVDFLLIAGGGAGGTTANYGSGGGGAGGYIYLTGQSITQSAFSVVIGNGGTGIAEENGHDTTFSGYTAIGGGHGDTPNVNGANGGCGGGAGAPVGNATSGGIGSQGFNGGSGAFPGGGLYGGGGGGIGSAGQNSPNAPGAAGGNGKQFLIFGTDVYGAGGASSLAGEDAAANTGNGGNGRYGAGIGGSGGSGIVKIRLKTSDWFSTSGGTKTMDTTYTYHTFTTDDTLLTYIIPPSATPSATITPTVTPSISISPTMTPSAPPPSPTPTPSVPSYWNGLISYYRMSETSGTNVADAVGSATGTRSAASMADANGINGYCNLFDAVNQNIAYGNNFGFLRTSTFSISLWLKRTNVNKWGDLIGKIQASGSYIGWYLIMRNTNVWGLTLNNATNKLEVTGGNLNSAGVWYHLVCTYDGSSSASGVKMYQNASGLTLNTLSDNLGTASLANSETAWSGYRSGIGDVIDGRLDELAIYNRVLTSGEVTSLYNGGAGKFY
jgi:hypothetical protein